MDEVFIKATIHRGKAIKEAEHLAQIAVLERLSDIAVTYNEPNTVGTIEAMIAELKEAMK